MCYYHELKHREEVGDFRRLIDTARLCFFFDESTLDALASGVVVGVVCDRVTAGSETHAIVEGRWIMMRGRVAWSIRPGRK